MNESECWLLQANSDRAAGDRELASVERLRLTARCHAAAKYQQSVEKTIKGLVAALREAGFMNMQVGRAHEVTSYFMLLLRMTRGRGNKTVQQHVSSLLEANTRAQIRALESLAPRWPQPGGARRRNTEYPFHDTKGAWTYPAADGVFSAAEVRAFQRLAGRLICRVDRIVSVIRRARPKAH